MEDVASLAEAWIEIKVDWFFSKQRMSLPSRKRGLKSKRKIEKQKQQPRRFPRGSVDWNRLMVNAIFAFSSRFPRGSVDWNYSRNDWKWETGVASLAEAWIEIIILFTAIISFAVASLAEAWIEINSNGQNVGIPGRFPRGSVDWNWIMSAWLEVF